VRNASTAWHISSCKRCTALTATRTPRHREVNRGHSTDHYKPLRRAAGAAENAGRANSHSGIGAGAWVQRPGGRHSAQLALVGTQAQHRRSKCNGCYIWRVLDRRLFSRQRRQLGGAAGCLAQGGLLLESSMLPFRCKKLYMQRYLAQPRYKVIQALGALNCATKLMLSSGSCSGHCLLFTSWCTVGYGVINLSLDDNRSCTSGGNCSKVASRTNPLLQDNHCHHLPAVLCRLRFPASMSTS
jgi:hypothetical protein